MKKIYTSKIRLNLYTLFIRLAFIPLLFSVSWASAQIAVNAAGFNYTQDFNTLATSGASNAWTNNTTLSGWYLFNKDNAAITTYGTSNAAGTTTGSFYSYGTTSPADRALGGTASGGAYFGSPSSGAIAGWIAVAFTNNTGATINSITLGFNGEQWRNGGNTTTQTMVLEYGFGATFASVATWTMPGGNFNWTSPVATATAAAVDGNVAGLVSGRGGMLNSLNWQNGNTLWIRWVEVNDAGNDHGLAIDDFTFSVPSASVMADQVQFVPAPPASVQDGSPFMVTVCATDGMNTQSSFVGNITLMQNSGPAAMISPALTLPASGGCATFTVTPSGPGSITITANSSGLTPTAPASIDVVAACPDVAITVGSCDPIIDFTGFTGGGFTPNPSAGQLCSTNWEVLGLSDGSLLFGQTGTSGDFVRGNVVYAPSINNTILGTDPNNPTQTPVTTGGIYALHYGTNASDVALWVQPSGSDFDPGSVTLKVINNSGSTLKDVCIGFDFLALNNESRDNSLDLTYSLMYSMTGVGYTPLINSATADFSNGSGLHVDHKTACITDINIANGEYIYLRWESENVGTSGGSRDEFGLDNISVCAPPAINIDAVATCAGSEKNQYYIEVSNVTGGDGGPYTISIAGQDDQQFTGTTLTFGPFDHSGIGGALKEIIATDGGGFAGSTKVAEVLCGYPQNQAFCDCINDDPDVIVPPDDEFLNAGAIMSQAAPGSFEIDGATQVYVLVQNGSILAVNKTGLFQNLPNGDYSVYAVNYRTDEEAQISAALAPGQPIQTLLDGVNSQGDLANVCYTICGPANYTVACGVLAEDITYTIPPCNDGTTVFYSFNLKGCTEDDLDLDLLDIDFGDLEDNLIPNPNARLASELPAPRTESAGDHVLFVEYALNLSPNDAGIHPVTIRFNGVALTVKISVISQAGVTDYTQLSCKGTVNVRLDDECNATLTASQVLKGALVCDQDFCVNVVYVINGRSYINYDGNFDYGCGQYIYRVYGKDANGNCTTNLVCWGYVNAEDKTPPVLECPREPVTEGVVELPVYTVHGELDGSDPTFDPTRQTCFRSTAIAGLPTLDLAGTYRYYDLTEFRVSKDGIYTFHLATDFDSPLGSGLGAIYVGAKRPGNPGPDFDPYLPCEDIIAFSDYTFGPGPWSGLGDYLNFLGNINGWSIFLSQIYGGQGGLDPTIRTYLKAGQTYTLLTTSTIGFDEGDYWWLIIPDNGSSKVDDPNGDGPNAGEVQLYDEEGLILNDLICTDKESLVLPSQKCYTLNADGSIYSIDPNLRAVLERTGFPYDGDVFGFDVYDNCGKIQVCVGDVTQDYGDCKPWVIHRTFTATDQCGNLHTSCTQEIIVRQPTLDDVVLPHYTEYVECDQSYETLPGTDRPSPKVTGYPFVVTAFGFHDLGVPGAQTYCKLGATYEDKARVNICDKSFTFIREWTIYDWCNPGRTIIYDQLIKVGDFTPPTVGKLPVDPWDCMFTASTGPFTCESNFTIPTPDGISDNCSATINYSVDILTYLPEKDDHGFLTGNYYETIYRQGLKPGQSVYNVPKGIHLFKYVVSDGCGNKTTKYYWFQVLDRSEPVAQCDDFLNISVSGQTIQGSTRIYAEDVNEGSYDDCGPIALKTRRAFTDQACADQYAQLFYNTSFDNLFLVEDFNLYQYGVDNEIQEPYQYYHTKVDAYITEEGVPVFTYEDGVLYTLLNDYVDVLCCDVHDSVRIELWVFDDANMNGIPGDFDYAWQDERTEWLQYHFCGEGPERTDYHVPCLETCGEIWDNHNVCWLDVLIEDKAKPICKPPQDITIACTNEAVRYEDAFRCKDSLMLNDLFGQFVGVDNCEVKMVCDTVIDTRSTCGTGTIIRKYHAEDGWGNKSASCQQKITVVGEHNYVIGFPADKSGDCGAVLDTCIYVQENACDLLAVAVKDTKFTASGDECYKIERTFKVINWCEYDGISDPYVVSRDVDGNGVGGDEDIWVIRRPTRTYLDRANKLTGGKYYQNLCASNVVLPSETDAVPGANTEGRATPRTDQFPDAPWNGSNPKGSWDWADTKEATTRTNDDGSSTKDKLYAPGQTGANISGDLTNYTTGYWQYTQLIKVYDAVRPEISGEPQVFCSYSSDIANNCPGTADIAFTIFENCTPNDLKIKAFLDGSAKQLTVSGTYPNYTVSGSFPLGDHVLEVHAIDGCGNSDVERIPFSIVDCKAPTPVCIHGIAVELMPVSPAADVDGDGDLDKAAMVIWAKDFIASPVEDCSGPVKYSINKVGETPDTSKTSIVVTCDDPATLEIEIYAWDNANNPTAVQPDSSLGGRNYDKCKTYVLIQDNTQNLCGQIGSGSIAGIINTEDAEPVENVDVQLSGPVSKHNLTNVQGQYTFTNLQTDYDYTITPTLDLNPINGVSTFDIILITKHILGVEPLNSPYKMIAADINNSKTITTLDLIQLRKLILSVDTQFSNNTSWRFVDASFSFPDPSNPWKTEFPEVRNINDLPGALSNINFVAIKVGDVNGNARTSSISGTEIRDFKGTFAFDVADQPLKAGNEYTIDFKAADIATIQGYQATLTFDANTLELADIVEGAVKAENFGLRFAEEGMITTSWNGDITDPNTVLFSLVFRTKTDADLSDLLGINSRYTPAEAYGKQDELKEVAIRFSNGVVTGADFELYQNVPNPFKNRTMIRFQLPAAADATLTISDVTGKVLKVVRGSYMKGMNQIELNNQELPAGVLTYTLQAGEFTATKKMVVLD